MKYVESPLHEIDHLHIRLYVAHDVTIDRSWNAEDVSSTYWRFYVNSRAGASVLVTGGEPYPLAAHRIHFVPAWVRWTCHNVNPIQHLFAHFDLVGLPGAVVRSCFPGPITLPADRRLEAECEELRPLVRARGARDPVMACIFKAVLYRCFARLLDGLASARAQRFVRFAHGHNPVAEAVRHIDEHLAEPLPNTLLARRCGFGEGHFTRLFRQHLGQTPAQYVLERRIVAAAEQLAFSDLSIERIAASCGFPDRFYFSRMFRRRMGQPPAAYRRASLV
ncbi:MAG: helix-turn-helix transcriptional regulator [Planctomycetes bacterium]|nr:helix-turn-helix transcriptional regulator [Planctomycetota bacterium]